MKSTELRIGNYYLSFGVDLKQVEELTKDKMLIDFHPITLTEDWLIKFGFEKINDVAEMWNAKYVWAINYLPTHKNNFALFETHSFGLKKPEHYNFENKVFDFRNGHGINNEIKYVHQLQNLYFALTGEELSIISP